MSQSKYQPLDIERKEIRLLEILSPGTDALPTTCRLSTVSLTENENISFAALSYVWGDASITTDIVLDGTAFPVTTNLAMALRYVKHHWQQQYPANDPESFRLWADAVCVNQSDIKERNNQVQMMASIYSMAEVVLSWLGADEEIGLAMQAIRLICRETRQTLSDHKLCLQWMEKYPFLCIDDDGFIGFGGINNKAWIALWNLFHLSYWRRTWTFQEMALAQNLVIVCDSSSIPYRDFHDFCVWYRSIYAMRPNPPPRPPSMPENVWTLVSCGVLDFSLSSTLAYAKRKSFPAARRWKLLTLCRYLHATDPRDQVYGLLAVIERDCKTRTIPDYEKTPAEVYSDSVSCWVEEDQTLSFLYLAGISRSKDSPDLPTWVPDFSQVCLSSGLYIRTGHTDRRVFQNTTEKTFVSGGVLKVKGAKIDVVQKMLETPTFDTLENGRMLSFCFDFVRRHPMYITGIPPLQAIYHTFMMTYLKYAPPYKQYSLCKEALAFLDWVLSYSSSLGLTHEEGFERFGLSVGDMFLESFEKIIYPGCNIHDFGLPNISTPSFLPPAFLDASQVVALRFIKCKDGHHFIETSEGYLGLAPTGTEVGDVVCILKGFRCPVILRKRDGHHVLVGTCHVLGIMNGEAADMLATGKIQEEIFEIW